MKPKKYKERTVHLNEKHSDEVRVEHVKAHHKTKKYHDTKYVDHGTKYVDHGTKYVDYGTKYVDHGTKYVEDYGTRYVNDTSSSTSRYVSRSPGKNLKGGWWTTLEGGR